MRVVTSQRRNGATGIGVVAGDEVISLDSAFSPILTRFLSAGGSAMMEAILEVDIEGRGVLRNQISLETEFFPAHIVYIETD